jgi:hypothetical protein
LRHAARGLGSDWDGTSAACGFLPAGAFDLHGRRAESELDFFLISASIKSSAQQVRVLDGAPVAKHSPVQIVFTGRARADAVLVHAKPPRRPTAVPSGCRLEQASQAMPPLKADELDKPQQTLDEEYGQWAAEADSYIGGLRGGHPQRVSLNPVVDLPQNQLDQMVLKSNKKRQVQTLWEI